MPRGPGPTAPRSGTVRVSQVWAGLPAAVDSCPVHGAGMGGALASRVAARVGAVSGACSRTESVALARTWDLAGAMPVGVLAVGALRTGCSAVAATVRAVLGVVVATAATLPMEGVGASWDCSAARRGAGPARERRRPRRQMVLPRRRLLSRSAATGETSPRSHPERLPRTSPEERRNRKIARQETPGRALEAPIWDASQKLAIRTWRQ